MAKQIYKYSLRESLYEYQTDLQTNTKVENISENTNNEKDQLYFYCYNNDSSICKDYKDKLINKYESLDGLIFSHDVINRFKDPGFSSQIIDSFVSMNINDSFLYGFNKTGLYSVIINYTDGNNINKFELNSYYHKLVNQRIQQISDYIIGFQKSNYFLFHELFDKVLTEMNEQRENEYLPEINEAQLSYEYIFPYARAFLGFYSKIELSNNKCYLINYVPEQQKYYYFQFNLIKNYLDIIGNSFSNESNMDLIPLYPNNLTIISPELCARFLMKQSKEMFNEDILKQTYSKIKKGVDGIEACIYDKKILENKKIKEMLQTNISHFLSVDNKFFQGLIELDQPYFFLKAPFPNLNLLKEFKTDYLLLDDINFYLFAPFKEPIEFANYVKRQYQNLFFLIVILILYIWIICFIVNMIIYCKVANQITEPIYKLQEAIENNNLKDENIFKYEYDDIINELFITCKELLTGQIDVNNTQKYTSQFNILNKQKDEDKIKYEKNLIINNEIITDLINEQQNMNDYSKEIGFNEDYNINPDIIDLEEHQKENNGHKKSARKKDIINYNDSKENQEIKGNQMKKKTVI